MSETMGPSPENPENRLKLDVDSLRFRERQALMKDIQALQERLLQEVGLRDYGVEMIDGTRIYVEGTRDGRFIVRGLENFFDYRKSSPNDPGDLLQKYTDEEEAKRKIFNVAEMQGYKIVKE